MELASPFRCCILLSLVVAGVLSANPVTITNSWPGGLMGEACVTFPETVTSWNALLTFESDINVIEPHHTSVTQVNAREFLMGSLDWNRHKVSGETYCFTFVARYAGAAPVAATVALEGGDDGGDGGDSPDGGNPDDGNSDDGNSDGGNTDGGNTDGGNPDGGNGGDQKKREKREKVNILEEWQGGFKGEACVDITENLNGWTAQLRFKAKVNQVEQWVGTLQKVNRRKYKISNPETLSPGDRKCFIIVVRCDCIQAPVTKVFIEGNSGRVTDNGDGDGGGDDGNGGGDDGNGGGDDGNGGGDDGNGGGDDGNGGEDDGNGGGDDGNGGGDDGNGGGDDGNGGGDDGNGGGDDGNGGGDDGNGGGDDGKGGGDDGNGGGDDGNGGGDATKDYNQALGLSILFYNAQRSGPLPANNPIPWRGDSALGDCVVGGWYDAGDHVKFGLPMASSSTLLLWSLVTFKDGYERAGQLDQMYEMIKWPLDYFLNAWDNSAQSLVVQVGDGNVDHSFWGRAEDMTMNRPCQSVNSGSKGSDIAAETAASLAAGAIAFSDKGDTAYGAELLTAARQLFSFATSNRGIFHGSTPFYSSSGDTDELCTAAMWLYRATGDNSYLNQAKTFATTGTAWALSWDDKKLACQIMLYEAGETNYKSAVESFFNSWLPNGGISYTPCGLAWRDTWGANRYAGNAAFAALLAAEAGINSGVYRKWAAEQINYMLGDNNINGGCYSFLIGYGSAFPQRPHHRGASCPDIPAPCGQNEYNNPGPNYQVLNGALVGGPDQSGNYNDVRSDYIANEVATDYNSGFQGALAGLAHLEETNNFPQTSNTCPCGQ